VDGSRGDDASGAATVVPEQPLVGDLGRVWTVPNALSVSRILLVGAYLYLLFGPNERVLATFALAVGGITDFLDGWIARHFDQVTTLGKVLDPVADRILLGAAMSSMIAYGAVPIWLAATVLGREALVTGAVLALASRGAPRIDVTFMGKAATFGLMVCFPLLLLGHGAGGAAHDFRIAGWVLVPPSLALSLAAALGYIPIARHALASQRAAGERGVGTA
jgi:cardiolipin synthase